MSSSTPVEEDLQTVMEFDCISFMESRGLSCVPETSFPHVEASQDTGVAEGMVVEIPLDMTPERYWLAIIVSAHGPLLRLSYVGSEDKGVTSDRWLDLSKGRLYPLGWCQMNKKQLEPPDSVKEICPHWQGLAIQYLEDIRYETVFMHDGDGVTPVERLKVGMALEVQDLLKPDCFWPAFIRENRGGLLTLEFEGLPEAGDVTLFYTSNRLFPSKYGRTKRYEPPVPMSTTADDWEDILQKSAERTSAPSDLIVAFTPEPHRFEVDAILEIIPPMADRAELAKVSHVWDESYFQVSLLSDNSKQYLCHQHSDHLFPVGWSERRLPEFRRAQKSDSTLKAADSSCFPERLNIAEGEFEKGQKLDVLFGGRMRSSSILDVTDNVVAVELDSDAQDMKVVALLPVPSTVIFPFGWALANYIPYSIPKSFCPQEEIIEPSGKVVESKCVAEEVSSWCPPIYFNYQCYSASFLSKAKLASLPKSVGPGSVYLVMKRVLELIIGSSYKSGSVLKRLECQTPRKDFVLECLKSKSRVATIQADVEIPTRADQVDLYCREVCKKVRACPYLLSTTLYANEGCPANCQCKPKSNFHAEEQSGILFRNRGRRGGGTWSRKRRHLETQNGGGTSAKGHSAAGPGGEEEEDGSSSSAEEESDETTEPPSTVNSRSASPENDGNQTNRKRHARKEWENILPRSEIRTRGAKLPDFKPHLKIRPTKKEQRAIENNSLRESIGYDKRTPGGKRGRIAAATGEQRNTPMKLAPAFRLSDIASENGHSSPPPIRELTLKTNPMQWTSLDTARFLAQTADCAHLANFMVQDEIDGVSFMLLNFETVKDFWSLTVGSAIRLCQHVESVKLACINQFGPCCQLRSVLIFII